MEGTYNVQECTPANPDLGEQDLVSCANNGQTLLGCNGGFADAALQWVKSKGICTETCFPYTATDSSCSNKCSSPSLWNINSYVTPGTTAATVKAYLICHGPIAVSSNNWGHVITLVAYDDNNDICQSHYSKTGCWIIKNSWGVFTGTSSDVYHLNGYGYIPYTGHTYSDIINTADPPVAPVGITAP
jgi:C1A family cysteine protease